MGSNGLGVANKMSDERPVVFAVKAAWLDPSARVPGIAGIDTVVFEPSLKYAADRQQNFETQIHEVATRLVTMLATAGPGFYGAAALRVMDWTAQTKRALVHDRALVTGALIAATRPNIVTTFLGSGKALADRIGNGRAGEAKADLEGAVSTMIGAEFRDAALAAWAALLEIPYAPAR